MVARVTVILSVLLTHSLVNLATCSVTPRDDLNKRVEELLKPKPKPMNDGTTNDRRRTRNNLKKNTESNTAPLSAKERRSGWGEFGSEESSKRQRERSRRMKKRRENAREKIRNMKPSSDAERMSHEDINLLHDRALKDDPNLEQPHNQWLRRAFWKSSSSGTAEFADPGEEWDWWAQAYRMLGGFIDCDHHKGDGSGSGSGDGDGSGCSRWMMWASYVNPNYGGGGREEYFGNYGANDFYQNDDDETRKKMEGLSPLDCHSPETEWVLMGVYRQEFYQFLEQISKHVWAIDEYEYIVALAGLAYMTDADCFNVGYDENGNSLYAGIQPMSQGRFQMSLYNDDTCINLNKDTSYTYDDFAEITEMDLDSGDYWGDDYDNEDYQQAYSNWAAAQTYTLDLINEVYTEYKYCTLCLDYPTYQDGYFIGDYGTDEDDLINQCWKFHSHDSFSCENDCIALAAAQGSIVQINYGGTFYGDEWDGTSGYGSSTNYDRVGRSYVSQGNETKLDKLKANLFVTASSILFVATFLAFAVARGSRTSEGGSKSRSLLSDDERYNRDKSRSRSRNSRHGSRRSKSKHRDEDSKDGRSSRKSSSRRSKSRSGKGKKSSSRGSRRTGGKTPTREKYVDDF